MRRFAGVGVLCVVAATLASGCLFDDDCGTMMWVVDADDALIAPTDTRVDYRVTLTITAEDIPSSAGRELRTEAELHLRMQPPRPSSVVVGSQRVRMLDGSDLEHTQEEWGVCAPNPLASCPPGPCTRELLFSAEVSGEGELHMSGDFTTPTPGCANYGWLSLSAELIEPSP